ncbi:hypothetical protein BC936DRAFT_147409 [Jimgerdemannia flammicorona]|uniref:Uncharacterized protein n=1 Tax=Jimgerdemannia flammicorona TaxID=994334 RepID=A0A433D5C9_9FUNG|nr:hypothetical protein BC936DRAFT_147409 [Jimgerdemannia flammicorona]
MGTRNFFRRAFSDLWCLPRRAPIHCQEGTGPTHYSLNSTPTTVYNTCLLTALPRMLSATLAESGIAKIQPLFCVGVNDISAMEQMEGGYVACEYGTQINDDCEYGLDRNWYHVGFNLISSLGTPDRIFAHKNNIYDLFVTIPSSYCTSPTEEAIVTPPAIASKPSSILLSPLVSHPEFISPPAPPPTNASTSTLATSTRPARVRTTPTKYNTTDLRRYRILRRLLIDSSAAAQPRLVTSRRSSFSNAFSPPPDDTDADNNTEDQDALTDTMRKMVLGGWFWWYGRDNRSTRRWRGEDGNGGGVGGVGLGVNGMGLFGRKWGDAAEEEEEEERSFFHLLSTTLLTTLRALLASAVTDADSADDSLFLYPEHLEQLGLDPSADASFVEELARIYFDKDVEVVRARGMCGRCWEGFVEQAAVWGCATVGVDGGCCCFEGLGV